MLKLGAAVCAPFIFQGQAAQYAQREAKNGTANAAASVVIFQYPDSTRWTSIDTHNLCGDYDVGRWIHWIYGARRSIVDWHRWLNRLVDNVLWRRLCWIGTVWLGGIHLADHIAYKIQEQKTIQWRTWDDQSNIKTNRVNGLLFSLTRWCWWGWISIHSLWIRWWLILIHVAHRKK